MTPDDWIALGNLITILSVVAFVVGLIWVVYEVRSSPR